MQPEHAAEEPSVQDGSASCRSLHEHAGKNRLDKQAPETDLNQHGTALARGEELFRGQMSQDEPGYSVGACV